MNTMQILLLAMIILITIRGFKRKKNTAEKGSGRDKSEEFTDYNDKFLAKAKNRKVTDLVKVFHHQDMMVLRSILDAEGIETYVKSNHFGELYPTYDLNNFATSIISVFEENALEAKGIVEDYLTTLKKEDDDTPSERAENSPDADRKSAAETPEPSGFQPELLI